VKTDVQRLVDRQVFHHRRFFFYDQASAMERGIAKLELVDRHGTQFYFCGVGTRRRSPFNRSSFRDIFDGVLRLKVSQEAFSFARRDGNHNVRMTKKLCGYPISLLLK